MATVLITGCDRGLGAEFAYQYGRNGDRVIATCLDADTTSPRAAFASNVTVIKLDVTDEEAVQALADDLRSEPIDILINNAGIPGPHPRLQDTDLIVWRQMLEVNLIAPFVVSKAFVEHVAHSDQKVIAFISSRMGSIGLNNTGGSYAYRSSKSGLNMVMKSLAIDLVPRGICVLGINPGNVPFSAEPGLSAAASVTGMRQVISEAGPHQTGAFYSYNGQILPW